MRERIQVLRYDVNKLIHGFNSTSRADILHNYVFITIFHFAELKN
jgi:hypothetical protein